MNKKQIEAIWVAIRVLRRELQGAEDGEGYITGTADIEMIYEKLLKAFPEVTKLKGCDL